MSYNFFVFLQNYFCKLMKGIIQQREFTDILLFIKQSQWNALKSVNAELINLYWNVGHYISERVKSAEWGDKTIDELANFIQKTEPNLKGFNRRGLYRMRQFYETYAKTLIVSPVLTQLETAENVIVSAVLTQLQPTDNQQVEIVSTVLTQFDRNAIKDSILAKISWTNHLTILSRCKMEEEREFYLRLTNKEKYSTRELDRQISAGVFERTMIGSTKLSPVARKIHPNAASFFKDNYVVELLGLPDNHEESDLQNGLIENFKNFLLEFGSDFSFIKKEFRLQVGNSDFFIDLLFYHRELQCLVAFELKTDKFRPEHLGQLDFYLEALDRDVKKPHENPSIGILLCKDKDDMVVEYALNRSLSPTLVSQYQTKLPDKKLLQQKIQELFDNSNFLTK